MTSTKVTVALLACLLAGCGRTMCDIPDANSASVPVGFHIENYGPRQARAGAPFNVQPDGSSAAWFKLDNNVEGSEIKVHFGDFVIPGNISGDVVTIKLPDSAHAKPGRVHVVIERMEGREVSKSNAVTVELDKP